MGHFFTSSVIRLRIPVSACVAAPVNSGAQLTNGKIMLANDLKRMPRPWAAAYCLLALLLLTFPAARGQAQSVTVDNFLARTFTDAQGNTLPYRLFVPAGYDPAKKYPLVLFLHGSGESGTDNRNQLVGQTAELVFVQPPAQAQWPCFMVAPQCPVSDPWTAAPFDATSGMQTPEPSVSLQVSMEILEALQSEFSIDSSKLYITGLSIGGYGTWDALTRYPGKFAAGIPFCGGGDEAKAAGMAATPVWAFHSADDPTVPVVRSRNMIAALRTAGGTPLYTEYDGYYHASWVPGYNEPGLLPWLFAQTPPVASVLADNAGVPQTVALGTAVWLPGISRYQVPNPPGTVTNLWSMVSGPAAVTFGDATAVATSANFPVAGNYALRLTVTDGTTSARSDTTVTVLGPAPTPPMISPGGGTFLGKTAVTLSDTTAGAAINYTLDGSNPTSASTLYSIPFSLTTSATVKAIAVLPNAPPSAIGSAAFTITKQVSLTPIADSYVQSGHYASAIYGTGSLLGVKRDSSDAHSDLNRASYLKFDLTALTQAPAKATLTLTVDSNSGPSGRTATLNVYSIADTTWTEKALTWNNAPSLNRTNFSSLGTQITVQHVLLKTGMVANFDLTAFITAHLGQVVSLQIIDPNTDQLLCYFPSREAATGKPLLNITY